VSDPSNDPIAEALPSELSSDAAAAEPVTAPAPRSVERANSMGRDEPVRSWSPLGTIDDGVVAQVDDAGLVQMRDATWSLDWWIGAEDRWHHPAREAPVRQRLIDGTPVVETAMRVPGGDVLHRVFAVRTSDGDWSGAAVVVEVENLTAVPVALAFAVRPITLDGVGRLESVAMDGSSILVNGHTVAVLSRPIARGIADHDAALAGRLSNGDDTAVPTEILLPGKSGGDAGAVAVVPLPHTSVIRVLLPLSVTSSRKAPAAAPSASWTAPESERVVAGWTTHTGSAAWVDLPEPGLNDLVAQSQRLLLVGATATVAAALDRSAPHPGIENDAARVLAVAEALSRSGLVDPLAPIARALADAQRLSGSVKMADRSDASVALIAAAAPLLAGPQADQWLDELVGPVARAMDRIARGHGRDGIDRSLVGWVLASGAAAMRNIDQPDVAAAADLAAATFDQPPPSDSSERLRARLARTGVSAPTDSVDVDGVPNGVLGWDGAESASGLLDILSAAVAWAPQGPRICDGWDPQWAGVGVEAHDVVTPWGRAGFALRWHGNRPAVLWEIEPGPGTDVDTPPLLTAPAIDPTWTGEGWQGEALLAEPPGMPPSVQSVDELEVGSAAPVATAPRDVSDSPSEASPDDDAAADTAPGEGESFA